MIQLDFPTIDIGSSSSVCLRGWRLDYQELVLSVIWLIPFPTTSPDLLQIFHNAPIPCPARHHFATEICAHFCYKSLLLEDIHLMHCEICEMGLVETGDTSFGFGYMFWNASLFIYKKASMAAELLLDFNQSARLSGLQYRRVIPKNITLSSHQCRMTWWWENNSWQIS